MSQPQDNSDVGAEELPPAGETNGQAEQNDTSDTNIAQVPCDYRLNHNNCFSRNVLGGFFIVPALLWAILLLHTIKAVIVVKKRGITNDGLRNYRLTLFAQICACVMWLTYLLTWAALGIVEQQSDAWVQALSFFFGLATGLHFMALTRHVVTYLHPAPSRFTKSKHSVIASAVFSNKVKWGYHLILVLGLQTIMGLGYLSSYRDPGEGRSGYVMAWNIIMCIHLAVPAVFVVVRLFSKASGLPEPAETPPPAADVDIDTPGSLPTKKQNPRLAHLRHRIMILIGLSIYIVVLALVPLQLQNIPDNVVLNVFMAFINFGLPAVGIWFVQRWTYQIVSLIPNEETPPVAGPEQHLEEVHHTATPDVHASSAPTAHSQQHVPPVDTPFGQPPSFLPGVPRPSSQSNSLAEAVLHQNSGPSPLQQERPLPQQPTYQQAHEFQPAPQRMNTNGSFDPGVSQHQHQPSYDYPPQYEYSYQQPYEQYNQPQYDPQAGPYPHYDESQIQTGFYPPQQMQQPPPQTNSYQQNGYYRS